MTSNASKVQAIHQQRHYAVRHDWGLAGAAAISTGVDVAVVVDVLSFTTTLSVAADLGITVLPHHLAKTAPVVVGACLRNAAAVAGWITDRHRGAATRLAVVSAGERWPDGSLRPGVEDLWGAGAVIAALARRGWTDLSPEAEVAGDAHRSIDGDPSGALVSCASGRELIAAGYPDDVEVAAEADASDVVPVMIDAGFVGVRPS